VAVTPFVERAAGLPRLGIGLSTEYGAGLEPLEFRDCVDFLEIGVDLERGLDDAAQRWVDAGLPTTWHFLDVNLEEPEDVDAAWLHATRDGARAANAAWICGDAGLWHVGPRDRGHGTLLPPVLCGASVHQMASAIRAVRDATGFEVLPENPPAHVLLGDLHPLAYFAAVAELADCGLLLDLAHLVIVQRALGLPPEHGLDAFPLERVVELHVAGGSTFQVGPHLLVDDDHGPDVQDATWALLDRVLPRCTALRAVVVECERNPPDVVRALVARVRSRVTLPREAPAPPPAVAVPPSDGVDTRRLQRALFAHLLDPTAPSDEPAVRALDPHLVAADPGGRRRDQLVGNVALEFVHTVRAAPPFLDGFAASPELRAAIRDDRPFALAFAAYADRVLPEGPWRALLALDAAMADARRGVAPSVRGGLSGCARLLSVPEGTVAAAEALAVDENPGAIGPDLEDVVVLAVPAGPHRAPELRVERLPPAIAELVRGSPLDPAALAAFCSRHDATPDEVAALVADLVSDGILAG
jgi:uncharacterized protein